MPCCRPPAPFKLLAEPLAGKVKTTDIKAMGLDHMAGNCLIRIDTDTGLTGIGAAGAIALAQIETIKPLLIGKASLAVEGHFQ
jgi:L-alanine-DL-glutamate epimerase-like enolase superfamily enzyme